MKQQVFVIHGGNASPTYEEYLEYLRGKTVSLEGLISKDWKHFLQERLGEGFAVYQPSMPNRQYARYSEWKLWFEKFVPFMEDGVILVGHSLGGIFLAKYLAEETFTKQPRAVLLVAAPHNRGEEPMTDFVLPESLKQFADQCKHIVLYQSEDDQIVPFPAVLGYQKELPEAKVVIFKDRGHFIDETFPELVEEIKSTSK